MSFQSVSPRAPLVPLPMLAESGENFTGWRSSIETHISSIGLGRYLQRHWPLPDVLTSPPEPSSSDPKIFADEDSGLKQWWLNYDRLAANLASVRLIIANSLPEAIKGEFNSPEHKDNVFRAWTELVARFQSSNPLKVARMVKRLYKTDCLDEDSLDSHLNSLSSQRADLLSCGRSFTDEEFGCIVITSLPESMAKWSSLFASNKSSILASELVASIRTHFLSLKKSSNPTPSSQPAAFITSPSSPSPSSVLVSAPSSATALVATKSQASKYRGKGLKCINCKRTGHTIEACYFEGGGAEGQAPWQKAGKSGNSSTSDDAPAKAMAAFVGTSYTGGGSSIHGEREDALLMLDKES